MRLTLPPPPPQTHTKILVDLTSSVKAHDVTLAVNVSEPDVCIHSFLKVYTMQDFILI